MTDIFRGGDPIVITTGGLRGPTGQGVATGGTAGQYLRKQSGTDYDTAWASIPITDVTGLQAALDGIEGDYVSQTGWINVVDDANILPNLGDVWEALQAVIDAAAGESVVYMPPGLYPLSQELKLPDYTTLRGAGHSTILKLMDTADADQNVITNSENDRTTGNAGNTEIYIADLLVDGNSSRTGVGDLTSHTAGCGIGFASVSNSIIQNVHSQNCKKHCFDIAASVYSATDGSGDPTEYMDGPSLNVSLLECSGTNSGDDVITTHHSGFIYIRNARCFASGGQLVATNSNGIEIDDGSYDVLVEGGHVKQCVRGIEVKAHDWAPAARRVTVIGLTCESNVRNFECRHIGFRLEEEEVSVSAKDVTFIGCTSITPTKRDGLGTSPRAAAVHAYENVTFRDFNVQGAGDLSFSSDGEDVQYTEDVAAASVNTGADTITVASNTDRWYTGQPFRYDEGDTPIGGLVNGTFYYSIYVDATTIKVASTLTNALAGTSIDLTSQGTGTHTLTQLTSPLLVGLHFKAKNIVLDGIHFRDVAGAAELIRFTGSCRGNITIRNVTAVDCAGVVVSGSGSVPGVTIENIRADTTVSPQPAAIVRMSYTPTTQTYTWEGIEGTGYAANMIVGAAVTSISTGFDSRGLKGFAAASNTTSVANRGVILASTTGTASAGGAIIACTSSPVASGDKSLVAASSSATASGERSFAIGCATDCTATAAQAAVLSSTDSDATAASAMVMASRLIVNPQTFSLAGGHNTSGNSLSANRKWEIDSVNGTIKATGAITGSSSFSDYGEFFENLTEGVIPLGTIVTLVGDKIRAATTGEEILGVVSGTAGVVLGDSPFAWSKRYLTGDFGELLYDVGPDPTWPTHIPQPGWLGDEDKAPMVPNGPAPIINLYYENPVFDPDAENVPRSQRPEEWTVVGLLGQVFVRVGADVEVGDYVAADGTSAGGATKLKCMKITKAYDAGDGYAVARCLLV